MYFLLFFLRNRGWIGALAIKTSSRTDLLASLSTPGTSTIAQLATYLFPWAALVSGIPILCIIIRDNLVENEICSKGWAILWAVIFPWVAAAALDYGDLLQNALNWGSILTTIPLNFMLPAYLYIAAKTKKRNLEEELRVSVVDEDGVSSSYVALNEDGEPAYGHVRDDSALPEYKALPCLSEKAAIRLAWVILVICGAGNLFVIVWQLKY